MGSTQEEAAGHGSRPSGEKDFPGTPFLSGGIALGAEMGRGLESSPQCPPLLGTKPCSLLGTGPCPEELPFGVAVGDGAAGDRQRVNTPEDFTCSQVL